MSLTYKTVVPCAIGFVAISAVSCFPGKAARVSPVPETPRLFTAVDTVRSLTVDRDGTLWASTAGGVVAWGVDGKARVWTTADGLPSNDVDRIVCGDAVRAETSAGPCRIGRDGVTADVGAVTRAVEVDGEPMLATADVDGVRYESTAAGLYRVKGSHSVEVRLPESRGSHTSALCVDGGKLVAALYGDGLWSMSGGRWSRVAGLPEACVDITALTRRGACLIAGSGSHGVWKLGKSGWTKLDAGSAGVAGPDIEAIASFDGATWASTFDHGLLRISTDGSVESVTKADGLSSNYPRAMTVFGGRLLVRHASGALDAFDGHEWSRAFGHELPRPYVSAVDASATCLAVGGWGGWASFDGTSWAYHYDEPELKGRVVTAVAVDGDTVWIGTQNAGLLAYRGGKYVRYQEAQGLGDDWVTAIAASNGRVLVGTYTGGLFEVDGDRVRSVLKVDSFAMRSVSFDSGGEDIPAQSGRHGTQAFVATPKGVYVEKAVGAWSRMPSTLSGGLESQAVLSTPHGVWVGSHAALAFVPRGALSTVATASR